MKKHKITDKDQEIVAEILNTFSFCNNIDEMFKEIEKFAKLYWLGKDPCSKCYCTSKEEQKYTLQYNQELMIDKYGHCDGLE